MDWYHTINDERCGPLSDAEMNTLLQNGSITSQTLVWNAEMTDWAAAGTKFAGLAPAVSCCECGRSFAASDLVTVQGQPVCAQCQPLVVQKIQEGVPFGMNTAGTVWRDGKFILTTDGAMLPDRCVKCNCATPQKVKRKLYWHHPAIYIAVPLSVLLYVIIALCVRKKATVHVGFCEQHRKRRHLDILIVWLGLIGAFAAMIGGFANHHPEIGGGGVILLLAALIYTLGRLNIVVAKRIGPDGSVLLRGACAAYLNELPARHG